VPAAQVVFAEMVIYSPSAASLFTVKNERIRTPTKTVFKNHARLNTDASLT
jgi:hypothetical protein